MLPSDGGIAPDNALLESSLHRSRYKSVRFCTVNKKWGSHVIHQHSQGRQILQTTQRFWYGTVELILNESPAQNRRFE